MLEHLYAVIMAGGGGTRLWPLSREQHPKQTLSLTGERTLFQISVDRLLPMLPLQRIFVITGADQVAVLTAQYPQLPSANFIIEPTGRGTAPCIGLAAMHLRHLDPDAVMIVVTADHYIEDIQGFNAAILAAAQVAASGYLVTLGLKPTYAATGYGYIHLGRELGRVSQLRYFDVEVFTEKPGLEEAERFLVAGPESGEMAGEGAYVWNSGMFVWHVGRILDEMARWMPELSATLMQLSAVWQTTAYPSRLQECWPLLKKETIDYGIMERADRVAVIPVEIGWSDIGIWSSVMDIHEADSEGNVLIGDVVPVELRNSMVWAQGGRLIAVVGIEDLIVVDTPDALLITRRDLSQQVRKIVEQLRASHRQDLL
jgi:mannose-1-phosphate guanylyltransferase